MLFWMSTNSVEKLLEKTDAISALIKRGLRERDEAAQDVPLYALRATVREL